MRAAGRAMSRRWLRWCVVVAWVTCRRRLGGVPLFFTSPSCHIICLSVIFVSQQITSFPIDFPLLTKFHYLAQI